MKFRVLPDAELLDFKANEIKDDWFYKILEKAKEVEAKMKESQEN